MHMKKATYGDVGKNRYDPWGQLTTSAVYTAPLSYTAYARANFITSRHKDEYFGRA